MDYTHIEQLSYRIRREIIKFSGRGGCFIGASLSCVEILAFLYTEKMNYQLDTAGNHLSGDIFLLSKGHDVPALYSLFAELGILEGPRLLNHLDGIDDIYWHPNSKRPRSSLSFGLSRTNTLCRHWNGYRQKASRRSVPSICFAW